MGFAFSMNVRFDLGLHRDQRKLAVPYAPF
jgi:hypothetical protein